MHILGYLLVVSAAFLYSWRGFTIPEALLYITAMVCGTVLIILHRIFKPWTTGDKKGEENGEDKEDQV